MASVITDILFKKVKSNSPDLRIKKTFDVKQANPKITFNLLYFCEHIPSPIPNQNSFNLVIPLIYFWQESAEHKPPLQRFFDCKRNYNFRSCCMEIIDFNPQTLCVM